MDRERLLDLSTKRLEEQGFLVNPADEMLGSDLLAVDTRASRVLLVWATTQKHVLDVLVKLLSNKTVKWVLCHPRYNGSLSFQVHNWHNEDGIPTCTVKTLRAADYVERVEI